MFSCKTTKEFSELTADDVVISLSKGACFGSCPVYKLSVYDGGFAHFEGKRFTEMDGKWLKKLDKKTYTALINAFDLANFSNFQDEYESEIADLQMVKISYNTKMVIGKEGRPSVLIGLQTQLESIIKNKEGWSQLDKKETSISNNKDLEIVTKEPTYNYSQIILEPRSGQPLARIISKYRSDYGLRLLEKISPNSDFWLLTYDMTKIEPKKMMNILKNDKSVKNASFNIKITSR